MADGVLPALLVLSIERKQIHDELIDLRKGEHLLWAVLDRHGYEGDVAVWGFSMGVTPAVGFLSPCALQS